MQPQCFAHNNHEYAIGALFLQNTLSPLATIPLRMRPVETLLVMLGGVCDAIATPKTPFRKRGTLGSAKLHSDVTVSERLGRVRVERNPIRTWTRERRSDGSSLLPLRKAKKTSVRSCSRSDDQDSTRPSWRGEARRGGGGLGPRFPHHHQDSILTTYVCLSVRSCACVITMLRSGSAAAAAADPLVLHRIASRASTWVV